MAATNAHNAIEKKRERIYRAISFSWDTDKTQHQAVSCGIHISYDLVGFIPVEELMKQETA